MNKRDRLLQYKQIRNGLPRYDLAAKQTASGYQQSDNFNIGTPSIQQGQDMSAEANMYKPSLQGGISTATPYYSMLKQPLTGALKYSSLMSGMGKTASDAALQASTKVAMQNLSKMSTDQMLSAAANNTLGQAMSVGAKQAGEEASKQAINETTKEATSALGGTVGTALSAVGAAYGLYNLGSGLAKGPSIPTTNMIDQSHNEVTQSINGVDYTTKSLSDTSAYDRMLKYGENSRALSNSISGIGAGVGSALAIGSLLGTSLGPLGIIGGGLLGGLIGGIGSIFGRNRRKRELRRRKEALMASYANQNKQAESVAASEGLRNEFDNDTYSGTSLYNADKGKTAVSYNLMNRPNKGSYGMVFDKDGYHLGPINSKVGKGETIVNFDEGKMAYIDKGKKRADDQYSSVQEGDNNYIAGNDIDWTNGRSFADQVAPMSKQYAKNEKLRKLIESNKNADNKTKELNLKQLDLMQQQLVESTKEPLNRQEMQHKIQNTYDGTMPQYDKGKFNLNWLQPLIYAGAYGIPNSQYNYYKNSAPQAANSYVRNSNADRALNILGQMHFDPYQQAQQVRDAYRQGIYNINQQGGLSAGQRTKMLAAHGNNYMMNMAKLYGEANDINNKYKQAYAQALMEAGEKDAARQQTALAQQQQAYREAVARRLLGMENANQGRLNMLGALGKNLFQQQEFESARDYNNRLIDLYDRQADLEERGFNRNLANAKNGSGKTKISFDPFRQSHGIPIYEKKTPIMYQLSAPKYPVIDDSRQYNKWENSQPYYFQNLIPRIDMALYK